MPRITPVHWRELERVFLSAGFRFYREAAEHRSYVKPGMLRPVVIPMSAAVPVAIIRNSLKSAGVQKEDYFRLLGL